MTLSRDEIHIWQACSDELDSAELVQSCETLLSRDEMSELSHFRFEKSRREYLVTRALVRSTLAGYANVDPLDLAFKKNPFGRPVILAPKTDPVLNFNISHTYGFIVCAVALDRRIGVDVEFRENEFLSLELANRFLTDSERSHLLKIEDPSMRSQLLLEYWTLKEAFSKAVGLGFSINMKLFSFQLQDRENIQIALAPELQEAAESWRFKLLQLTSKHQMAVALEKCSGPEPDFKTFQWSPPILS